MQDLLSVTQAETLIRDHIGRFDAERIALTAASGRILRQDIRAERALPPFDRVMMDGIACRLADGPTFHLAGMQRAGAPPARLPDGAMCLEVTTGAVLPEGADTVIPVERLLRDANCIRIRDDYTTEQGQFIHRRGADCAHGDALLTAGHRLTAPAMAVLASNGFAQVDVATTPSIGIVSTGDELVAPDEPVHDWQIRRSNEYALAGALHKQGFHHIEHALVRDDLDATIDTLEEQLARHDVLVMSGGVSMGEYDYVPRALEQLGVTRIFHKIAQRPGKPMWFGVGRESQSVFALPGNPVSALVCGARYVVPALLHAQGLTTPQTRRIRVSAPVARVPSLTRFVPVHLLHGEDGVMRGVPHTMPTSGDFNRLANTDGIITLDPGTGDLAADETAVFHEW